MPRKDVRALKALFGRPLASESEVSGDGEGFREKLKESAKRKARRVHAAVETAIAMQSSKTSQQLLLSTADSTRVELSSEEDPLPAITVQDDRVWMERVLAAVRRSAPKDDLAKVLEEKPNSELDVVCDADGNSALHWAAFDGRLDAVELLLTLNPNLVNKTSNSIENSGQTPLHWAVSKDRMKVARLLVQQFSARKDLPDQKGYLATHVAAQHGHTVLLHMLVKEFGMSPLSADKLGNTPLHWAALRGHHHIAQYLLLSAKTPPDVVNDASETPLHYAATSGNGRVALALLQAGADPNVDNKQGESAWVLARRYQYATVIWALRNSETPAKWSKPRANHAYAVFVYYTLLLFNCHHHFGFSNLPIFFNILVVLSLLGYMAAVFGNPGVLPNGDTQNFIMAIDSSLANGISLRQEKFCFTCFQPRPARSKHCGSCNRCIDLFDHHCLWTNNCIGRWNRRFLLLFLLTVSLGLPVFVSLSVTHITSGTGSLPFRILTATWRKPLLLGVCALAIPATVFSTGLLAYQLFLLYHGRTTNEWMNRGRYQSNRPHPNNERDLVNNLTSVIFPSS